MLALKITIVAFINDDQPGFVEARLTDAWNKEFVFHAKVPIFTKEHLDANSNYPQQGVIACMLVKEYTVEGRQIMIVNTEKPWAVDSINGIYEFEVLPEQLIETELIL